MRPYGAVRRGHDPSSGHPFQAASARAIEKRDAESAIEEQIESEENEYVGCESWDCWCFMGDFPWDEDNMWDDELGVVFDHGPLRVTLLEAL